MRTPQSLEEKHNAIQGNIGSNQMRIADGVVIDVEESQRFGFEFFRFRSPQMVTEMDMFIKYAKGRKCFVDAGALWGIFSLVFNAINPKEQILAFEPSGEAYAKLRDNCKPFDNIHCLDVALSDENGVIRMNEEWEHLVYDKEGSKEIVCVKFDSWCNGRWKPDIIKIDVESMELEVMNGMVEALTTLKPVIFLETHPGKMGVEKTQQLERFIWLLGYKILDTATEQETELSTTEDQRLILIP